MENEDELTCVSWWSIHRSSHRHGMCLTNLMGDSSFSSFSFSSLSDILVVPYDESRFRSILQFHIYFSDSTLVWGKVAMVIPRTRISSWETHEYFFQSSPFRRTNSKLFIHINRTLPIFFIFFSHVSIQSFRTTCKVVWARKKESESTRWWWFCLILHCVCKHFWNHRWTTTTGELFTLINILSIALVATRLTNIQHLNGILGHFDLPR